ncbi:MAG: hydrogenase maturation protease [bacterium]
MKSLLILGIGNPIRGDDGVGIAAAARLRDRIACEAADIGETSEGGFALLSLISGYEAVIMVDAIRTREGRPGDVHRFSREDLGCLQTVEVTHNAGIPAVLTWAEHMGIPLPTRMIVYAIEIEGGDTFCEGLSHEVENAIPRVVALIEKDIDAMLSQPGRGSLFKPYVKEGKQWRFKHLMRAV